MYDGAATNGWPAHMADIAALYIAASSRPDPGGQVNAAAGCASGRGDAGGSGGRRPDVQRLGCAARLPPRALTPSFPVCMSMHVDQCSILHPVFTESQLDLLKLCILDL